MNTLKLACIASVLATGLVAGVAQASTHCDGFEIKIKNKLADDLIVTRLNLQGAEIQPGGLQKIDAKSEQVFTVNKSSDAAINGDFVFHTISVPSKEVKIQFELSNKALVCEHTNTSPASDYSVESTRLPGKVDYTISNK